jgi:hypothetical protein
MLNDSEINSKAWTVNMFQQIGPFPTLYAVSLAIFLVGCSANPTVEEATYQDGLLTGTAVVQGEPNGGWQTIHGDPVIAVNGGIANESALPYGGGDEGIRLMEDEQQ